MDEGVPRPEKSKGKAAEKSEESGQQAHGKSLGSRILDSASGLLGDFTSGSNGEFSSILASTSALGGKSQGPSAPAGNSAWNDRINVPQSQAGGAPIHLQNPNIYDSFRSLHVKTPIDSQMDAFMADTVLSHHLNEPAGSSTSAWGNQFNNESGFCTKGPSHNSDSHQNGPYIPEVHDGAEVTQLLSDPTFAGSYSVDTDMTEDLTQEQVNDLFPQNFTATEQHMVDYMRSNLPPAPKHKAMPFDHPLNLRPTQQKRVDIQDLAESLENGLDGYFASPELRERWFSEWNDVLNSYTDEVWGELLPDVRTARTELEEMRVEGNSLDSKAIARLKMILGHVSQPRSPDVQPRTKRARRAWSGEYDVSAKPKFHCPWITCHEVSFQMFPKMWWSINMVLALP